MSIEQKARAGSGRSVSPPAPSTPTNSDLSAGRAAAPRLEDAGPAEKEWDRVAKPREREKILDTYRAKSIVAGAALVAKRRRMFVGNSFTIRMVYPPDRVAGVQPEFEKVLWRARAIERQSTLVIGGKPSHILTEMLYSVIIYMLGVLYSVEGMPYESPSEHADEPRRGASGRPREERVGSAVKIAENELERLQRFAHKSGLSSALQRYVLGLPIGVIVVGVLAWMSSLTPVFDLGEGDEHLVRAIVAGGIGATASVMIRITRGQRLEIDFNQGSGLIVLAGAFRPLVGAVLGVALYVLLQAGLMPLEIPPESGSYFFSAIAFLGGFSERWAQDTILKSTPMRASATDDGTDGWEGPARRERDGGAKVVSR